MLLARKGSLGILCSGALTAVGAIGVNVGRSLGFAFSGFFIFCILVVSLGFASLILAWFQRLSVVPRDRISSLVLGSSPHCRGGALRCALAQQMGFDYAPDSSTAFKYLVSALIGVVLLFVARGARFGADGALGVGAVGLLGFSLATVLFSIMPLWLLASFVTGLYSALLVFMMALLLLRGHDGDRPVVFSAGFFLVLYGFVSGLSTSVIPSVTMPAPLQDAKAGVRWLRAHAEDYNINPDCIIATGSSAGGYMGVMLGVLGNTAQYNDKIQFDMGDNLDRSSAVQGALDFYGVSDLTIIGAGLSNYDVHDSESKTEALLVNGTAFGSNPGGSVFGDFDKTAIYSSFTYLDKNDAPICFSMERKASSFLPLRRWRYTTAARSWAFPLSAIR